MSKSNTNTTTLLDLDQITEPFDLSTALKYMKEHGEIVRCKNNAVDFYMYIDIQKRPVTVNGRRQFKTVETVQAFNQWGGSVTAINTADLFNEDFYIMQFDEDGNPDWTDPTATK